MNAAHHPRGVYYANTQALRRGIGEANDKARIFEDESRGCCRKTIQDDTVDRTIHGSLAS